MFICLNLILNKFKQTNKSTIYHEYTLYPRIIKDLSFIINNTISFNEIKESLYLNVTKFLTHVNLLDEYKRNAIPENHTSLCLQLIFQPTTKTLQNKSVENIINNLQFLLLSRLNAKIRI
jgi:phenylalanyl-tRNA synthetase beta chain